MQYGKVPGVVGVAAANATLAFTGMRALLLAEAAAILILAGLVLLRVSTMRRRRKP